jgi:F0F1-type ATP synthase membrane subunit b/b'
MDKLKARNTPSSLIEYEPKVENTMVQMSERDWNDLLAMVRRVEALSAELPAQRASLQAEASKYAEAMAKAAQEQTRTAEEEIKKIAKEANEQVGNASERASRVINRRIIRDEAIWFIRLILTAAPMILVLLLWARVGLGI